MLTDRELSSRAAVLGLFDPDKIRTVGRLGLAVLRYGLVALLLLWGAFKFAAFEAEGIRPLVENSPLLGWLYPLFGVRGTSALIGVVEIASALLIASAAGRRGCPRSAACSPLAPSW